MTAEIRLTNAECREHFFTIGRTGLGFSSIAPGKIVELPHDPVLSRSGPWDAIEQCIIELDWATDLLLTRSQMRRLLQQTGLMAKIIEFGEVETQIRENLASEMSKALIDEVWPTNGDIRDGLDFDHFLENFYRAAEASGFSRSRPTKTDVQHLT